MVIHNQVCNYCGDQIELPIECEEDSFFNKDKIMKSKIYGLSLDVCCSPIKSFEGYRRRNVKASHLSFCGKGCVLEFFKKALSEEGILEVGK
jgi:hypothetical protein